MKRIAAAAFGYALTTAGLVGGAWYFGEPQEAMDTFVWCVAGAAFITGLAFMAWAIAQTLEPPQ